MLNEFSALNVKETADFTLAGILAYALILVILLAVGSPGFQIFLQNAQIRGATESMQSALALARAEAVRRNAPVSLWLVDRLAPACRHDSQGKSWVVSQDDPAGRCNRQAADDTAPRLIQAGQVNPGSTNVSVLATARPGPAEGGGDGGGSGGSGAPGAAAAAFCITFDSMGRVEAKCGQNTPLARIRFQSAVTPETTRALELRMTPGGAVRLCEPAAIADAGPTC